MKNQPAQIKKLNFLRRKEEQNQPCDSSSGVETAATAGSSSRNNGSSFLKFLGKFWAWFFLIVLVFYFSFYPGFFDLSNFQSLLANNALLLVLALGQTFVIITGGIDLSTGFVMGLASVTASLVMRSLPADTSLIVVLLLGLLSCIVIGLIAGFVNGIVISHLKVPPFIATLGMYGIARGIGYVLSGGPPVSVNITAVGQMGNGYVLYLYQKTAGWFKVPEGVSGLALRDVTSILPLMIIYATVLFLVMDWILARTKFGQHVYAVGGNQMAALRAGISVKNILTKVYIFSGIMASIAGFLYVLRYTGGVASAGDALNLNSIAAIAIGGASMLGGEGTMLGTLVGAVIIAVITNGLIIVGIDPFWQYVAVGLIIILAVLVDQVRNKVLS